LHTPKKEETQKSLKELQENTTKRVKELNKIIQHIKVEVETIKKKKESQKEITLEIENLRKRSGAIDASINNRIQEIVERISGAEDSIENMDTTMKENLKCKKILTQNIQEIQDTVRSPNQRLVGIRFST
jgi:chromosome segregation ATPase